MVLSVGDKRRENYLKNGDILRRLRNVGGMSKGCIAGGITLVIPGVLLWVLFAAMGMAGGGFFFGALFGIPGLLLILAGTISQKRKMSKYLDYYQEATGFSVEELRQVERELMAPDMFMLGNVPDDKSMGASEKKPQIACMITEHYFFMPMLMGQSYIRRLPDMLMATYSDEIPGINGYKSGLVFLSRMDDDAYINAFLTEDVCDDLINELKKRNPSLITQNSFKYKERYYNILTDGTVIAKLFTEISAEDLKGGGIS